MQAPDFSHSLQKKIRQLKDLRVGAKLGSLEFASNLLMAPMASIGNAPFRLLMEELGAGGTISELISCHGINHGNQKTLSMLRMFPEEKHAGLQLFGEDTESMVRAIEVAKDYRPKWIDINMGCPVKKVVTKGGGAALIKDCKELFSYLYPIRKSMDIPLTIKVRTGWDANSINSHDVMKVARDCGVEFVSIHGRTRAQAYTGLCDWSYLEDVAAQAELPVVGNGDLHQAHTVRKRRMATGCSALMIARGAIRNPFIFLEAEQEDPFVFHAEDYFEVIKRYAYYAENFFTHERTTLVQTRKHILWFAAGFPSASTFRGTLHQIDNLTDVMKMAEDYFMTLGKRTKHINYAESFMTSGHG